MGLMFGTHPSKEGEISVAVDFANRKGFTVCESRYEKNGPDEDLINKGLFWEEIGFFEEKVYSDLFMEAVTNWRKQNPIPEKEDQTEKYFTTKEPWKYIKKNTLYKPAEGLNWMTLVREGSDKGNENTLMYTEEEFKETFKGFLEGTDWEIKK